MNRQRLGNRVGILTVGALAAAALLSGCTQGRWSPTGDAMATAGARGTFSQSRGTAPAPDGFLAARPARRSLVLADDSFSRMASTTLEDHSNRTATASVDPGGE